MKDFEVAVYLGALTLAPTSTPSRDSGLPRHYFSRTDLGIWFPSSLGSNSFTAHHYCVDPRSQCGRGRSSFHCGVSTLGDWLSDSEPGKRNKFRRRAMVGGQTYTGAAWFGVETWVGILGGAILGLCWYGVVRSW
jgi:hypothetical protein